MPDAGAAAGRTPRRARRADGLGQDHRRPQVAKLLGRPFVDADEELEARTGRTVAEWFAEGEAAFRDAEAELLDDLLGRRRAAR